MYCRPAYALNRLHLIVRARLALALGRRARDFSHNWDIQLVESRQDFFSRTFERQVVLRKDCLGPDLLLLPISRHQRIASKALIAYLRQSSRRAVSGVFIPARSRLASVPGRKVWKHVCHCSNGKISFY